MKILKTYQQIVKGTQPCFQGWLKNLVWGQGQCDSGLEAGSI
jgi:hypothetical protein